MLGALEEVESFGEFAKRNNAVASTDVKSFEPVSYTHLDVYKRQAVACEL